jgi:ribosome maturation factor RimP
MHGSSRHGSPRPVATGDSSPAAGPAEAQHLTGLLGPVVSARGMDLESVRITAVGRRRLLRVVVDADGGVSLDDITLISRVLSDELDANGAMGEAPYTLEVTSPGVDRPLTEPQHWRRAAGRLVRATLAPRSAPRTDNPGRSATIEGRVLAAGPSGVLLEVAGEQREFSYAELGPGKILLEFTRAVTGADGGRSDGH